MFHKFLTGETFDEYSTLDQCYRCGGVWLDVVEGNGHYSMNGEHASQCTGSETICHHYKNECPENDNECKLNPECNCLFCRS